MKSDPRTTFFRLRTSTTFIALSISLAAFTENVLYGLIIPLLPFTLRERIAIPPDDIQRATSYLLPTYGAGSILGSIIAGALSSRTSTQTPYILSLAALAACTALFAFARTLPLLLVARALQGLSSAAIWTVGLVILTQVAGENDSGKLMGYVSAAAALGYMAGPAMGGLVYDTFGYYPVYGVATVLVILDIVLRLVMKVPNENEKQRLRGTSGDEPREEEATETTSLLNADRDTTVQQHSSNFSSTLVLSCSPAFLALLIASFTEHVLLTGLETILPNYLSHVFDYSASQISALFFLLVLPTLFSPLVGKLSDRFGARAVCTTGLMICVPGLVALGFVQQRSQLGIGMLFSGVVVLGVGIALIMTPLMAVMEDITLGAISKATQNKRTWTAGEDRVEGKENKDAASRLAGIGYSATNVVMMLASISGPLICGSLVEKAGWAVVLWALAGWCVLAAGVVWGFLRTRGNK